MGDVGLARSEGTPAASEHSVAVTRMIDHAVAAAVLDASGRVISVSSRWCELTGWASDQVEGVLWSDLFLAADRSGNQGRLRGADGRTRRVRCESTPLPAGSPGGRLELLFEATGPGWPEEVLHSAGGLLATLIDSVHLGVLVVEQDGTVVSVNTSFLRELGVDRPPEMFLGQPIAEVKRHFRRAWANPGQGRALLEGILRRREPVTDAHFEMRDGRTLAVSFVPVGDAGGPAPGQMWLLRDVTDELAVAVEREYLLAIEKEQNTRLKELDAMKSQLVASVSHELRTPLTSIVSFTGLLRDGLGSDPVEDQVEFLDVIERNTDRLLRLVDDLLLLDKLDSNLMPLEFEPVNLPQLVAQALASIRPLAEEHGLDLELACQQGPLLQGDSQRLGQLVDNLLTNAVKFTPPGGRVSVGAAPEGDGWRLEVRDTGIGVPAGEQGEIFDRFFRASNARRQAMAGSGLGLAIVKRIVQAHGGSIEITSDEGEGTTCAVVLPGAGPPAPHSARAPLSAVPR